MPHNHAAATRLAALYDRLKRSGHRLTPQRLAIIRALVEHSGHPTVEQLHAAILAEFPTTSLATVYKTIALLKDQGEVLELGFGELGSRYDGRRSEPHPHLICTSCGVILDPDCSGLDPDCSGLAPDCGGLDPDCGGQDAGLQALVDAIASRSGFAVTSHRFDLFGLCPACRASA